MLDLDRFKSVNAVQDSSARAVEAIRAIVSTITDLSEISMSVSSAVTAEPGADLEIRGGLRQHDRRRGGELGDHGSSRR